MDHSVNTLTAAIKSLQDAVAPAVDGDDPLARQQLSMVIDFLGFLRSRLPHLHTRAWLELNSARQLAARTADQVAAVREDLGRSLADAVAASDLVLADPSTTNDELEECRAVLLAILREATRASVGGDPQVRKRLLRTVLDDCGGDLTFTRSWYLPLGFDPYPDQVHPLDQLVDARRSAATAE